MIGFLLSFLLAASALVKSVDNKISALFFGEHVKHVSLHNTKYWGVFFYEDTVSGNYRGENSMQSIEFHKS